MTKTILKTALLLTSVATLVGCGMIDHSTKTTSPSTADTGKEVQDSASSSSVEQSQSTEVETTTSSETSMEKEGNLEAIMQGDYSSIAGTWRNGEGDEFILDATGVFTDTPGKYISNLSTLESGYLRGGVRMTETGAYILFFPKNVAMPAFELDGEMESDLTDLTKERIMMGQGLHDAETIARTAYYRVD